MQSGQIANFSSIGGMVLSARAQQEKIGQWQQFWDDAKKARLQTSLITSGQTFGFKDTSFDSFYQTLAKDFQPVSIAEYAKVSAFSSMNSPPIAKVSIRFQAS
jgi:hypothetical protein